MKAFHFRLPAVLTLREQVEEAARQSCARAYSAVATATERLRDADAAIVASDELRRTQLVTGAPADQFEPARVFGILLTERRAGRMRELAEVRSRAEEAWRLLVAATQGREAMERLRRRQQSQHAYQEAQTEQKTLDELAGQRKRLVEAWREPATTV